MIDNLSRIGGLAATALLVTCMPVVAATSDAPARVTWNAIVDVRYDDNLGLAPDNASRRDTITTRVGGGVTWQATQTATTDFSLSASPFYDFVTDLEDLSNYGVTLGMHWHQQFNANFTAPFVVFDLNATWLEFEDSEIRDGYKVEAELALGKQFGEYFGARIGGKYHYRESTEDNPVGTLLNRNSDEVFDLERGGPFIRFDVNPAPSTSIFFEYNYMTGDVAATGSATGFNDPALFDSARDFAFEESIRFVTWRIEADQDIYTLGLNHSFTDKLGLQMSAIYIDAEGASDNNYDNTIVSAGLSWQF